MFARAGLFGTEIGRYRRPVGAQSIEVKQDSLVDRIGGRSHSPLRISNANDYHSHMIKIVPSPSPSTRPPQLQPPTPAPTARRIRSYELFGGSREVRIDHDGVEYRLTRTRQGKLILTK